MNLEENLKLVDKLAYSKRRVVMFDASKSLNKISHHLAYRFKEAGCNVLYLPRNDFQDWFVVAENQYEVDSEMVTDFLSK